MAALDQLAAEWGVDRQYVDARGRLRTVDAAVLHQIIEIVSCGHSRPEHLLLPGVIVLRQGRRVTSRLRRTPGSALVRWEIVSGGRSVADGRASAEDWRLPEGLPSGTYQLVVSVKDGGAERSESALLLVAPKGACSTFRGGKTCRVWALGVQLYAVRSRSNWGHGDFTDLLRLLELAAGLGAAGIGLNPLHALFLDEPEHASPYSPSSRLFLNPLYIDLDAVPEFPGIRSAGLEHEVERLRRTRVVDYTGAAAAKLAGLELAFRSFRQNGAPDRVADFEAFRRQRGEELRRFASFETLARRFGRQWPDWPAPWRNPDSGTLQELRESAGDRVQFWEFVQWLADRQLRACHDKARDLELAIGMYMDVAIGVDPYGADAWSEQAAIMAGVSVGAPPDPLNTAGQNWGIATFNPRMLEQRSFEPFRRTLQVAMCYAGAIRLDHVLGLNRLYLIPHGVDARDGAYIRLPLEAMLAVVAQESVANQCVFIGEDLGTVPDELRGALTDWGVWSYRVMLFERAEGGCFKAPEDYAEQALVTFSTHDLPTFAGWWVGHDLGIKHALGIDPGESDQDRANAKAALAGALARSGQMRHPPASFLSVASYLAATPSRLLLISIEDALGMLEQPNMPGTDREHPNWGRRLPVTLERLGRDKRLLALARLLEEAGRASGPQTPRERKPSTRSLSTAKPADSRRA